MNAAFVALFSEVKSSFIRIVHVLAEDFVHREHMHFVLLEHSSHTLIAANHAFIAWILQVVGANVGPYAFHRLWARKLLRLISAGLSIQRLAYTYLDLII